MEYNFTEIEKKWQQYWRDNKIYKVDIDHNKPKFYVLDMFPYPSGAGLHVGHPLGYIASDIYARYKRLKGFNVLHPMGYDAYGLPAEQYAIQTGTHPAVTTEKNINRYREQMDKIGFSYDWDREVRTCEPGYYKWTQWTFLQLFNSFYCNGCQKAQPISKLIHRFEEKGTEGLHVAESKPLSFTAAEWKAMSEKEQQEVLMNYRLAYQAEALVNWCPKLGTVLANDEVVDGLSVRGGYPVVRKSMKQWLLRITAYAERLLTGLETVEWSESVKEIQRNWIGKSMGASVIFKVDGKDIDLEVFTTRADTLFGTTFMVLAPEHELVREITTEAQRAEVEDYITRTKNRSERERMAEVRKVSGAFTGAYGINPITGAKLPIWIADYVLMGYGTGAIMAVPAHDDRDWEFARKFSLPIIEVVAGGDVEKEAYTDIQDGVMVNSGFLNGLSVNSKGLYTLGDVIRVLDLDVEGRPSEGTGNLVAVPCLGDGRIYAQTVIVGEYAQNVLCDGYEVPCGSTCEPAVLSLAEALCILAGYHLCVYIGLCAVQSLILLICGSNAGVVVKCQVAQSCIGSGTYDPGVVVAEYAGIFLVAAGIGGNLTVFNNILCEGGVVEHQTMLGSKVLVNGCECLVGEFLSAYIRHYAEALGLDEDLALFVLLGAYLLAVCIVCTQEPVAVPAVLYDGILHSIYFSLSLVSLFVLTHSAAQLNVLGAYVGEHTCDHYGFSSLLVEGLTCLGIYLMCNVGCGVLEGLTGNTGEAVEIEAVVPVCTADKGQPVRTLVVYHMVEGSLQVIQQGLCQCGIVLVVHLFIKYAVVACFLDVCGSGEYHPQRIVVEVGACGIVALLGKRLVLMIVAAVLKLGSCNIEYSLPCSFGYLMNEAQKILVGVSEAHASADAALEVGCGAGQVEGDHALVLVPDVDLTVELFVGSGDGVLGKKLIPGLCKLSKTCISLFSCVVLLHHLICPGLVHGAVGIELFGVGVLHIAQYIYKGLFLTGGKGYLLVMACHGGPAVGYGVCWLAVHDGVGIAEGVVDGAQEALPVGVKAVYGIIYGVEGKMIAALLVFGLVVDGGAFDLNFAGVEVSLEVGGVIHCIPQTPFQE